MNFAATCDPEVAIQLMPLARLLFQVSGHVAVAPSRLC